MAGKLSSKSLKLIDSGINYIFETVLATAVGPKAAGKQFHVGHDPFLTLEGLFNNVAEMEHIVPDKETLDNLVKIAVNYLEAAKYKAKAKVTAAVEANIKINPDPNETFNIIQNELTIIWASITADVERIVASELTKFKNVCALTGIMQANAHAGVNDPTVYFIVIRDGKACENCTNLHLLPSGMPRLWKLSQVSHDYYKKGQQVPSIMDTHPHGRCTIATLLPGWGFDASGMPTWRGDGWDEHAIQQQLST